MEPIIDLRDVTFTYLNAEAPAIEGVNLQVLPNTVTAIVGRVGSGKSTLLMTLNGIVPKYIPGKFSGEIVVDGLNVADYNTEEMAAHISLVFSDPALQVVALTVEEDVAFGPANLGLPAPEVQSRVKTSLAQTRLSGYEKRNTRQLSGGEQQRLALAGIMAMRPRILALDEPVSMLDPLGKDQVLGTIRELSRDYGLTILISDSGTDIESICDFADRMVLLNNGRVIREGTPGEVLADRQAVQAAGIRVPQLTRVFWNLGWAGSEIPTRVDEAVEAIGSASQAVTSPRKSQPTARRTVPSADKLEKLITVRNVWHTFPGTPPVTALRGVSLDVYAGELIALLGQNGAGKSTLAYHLVGIYKPSNTDAEISVCGHDVINGPLKETIRLINYVFQNPSHQLFCKTFGEEVAYGPTRLGFPKDEVEKIVESCLDQVGLAGYADEYTVAMTKAEETLLSLATVLAIDPRIIIADEPTGGLDEGASRKVMSVLRDLCLKGRSVIVITHDMELAATYASRAVVMNKGEVIFDGDPRELFINEQVLKEAWLRPPQVTQFHQRVMPKASYVPLTVDEFLDALQMARGE